GARLSVGLKGEARAKDRGLNRARARGAAPGPEDGGGVLVAHGSASVLKFFSVGVAGVDDAYLNALSPGVGVVREVSEGGVVGGLRVVAIVAVAERGPLYVVLKGGEPTEDEGHALGGGTFGLGERGYGGLELLEDGGDGARGASDGNEDVEPTGVNDDDDRVPGAAVTVEHPATIQIIPSLPLSSLPPSSAVGDAIAAATNDDDTGATANDDEDDAALRHAPTTGDGNDDDTQEQQQQIVVNSSHDGNVNDEDEDKDEDEDEDEDEDGEDSNGDLNQATSTNQKKRRGPDSSRPHNTRSKKKPCRSTSAIPSSSPAFEEIHQGLDTSLP
ncbi:hypothetical protein KCU73_g2250, partial [Aureobasidium melanogenum]